MKRAALCVAVVLLLLFCGLQGDRCGAEQPPQVVYLNQAHNWHMGSEQAPWVRVLTRELTRQAFLLAARDELGLATRDVWLGDTMPSDGDNKPWDITARTTTRVLLEVTRGFAEEQVTAVGHEVQVSEPFDYLMWTEKMESLSRTKFTETLKNGGFRGRANARNEKAAVPESVEELLGQMELVSQFLAIRELHEMIHNQGESRALLGGLVRGYANLGVMTEYFWHPAHKVFKARALLYAQRMVARDKGSSAAKLHRAYAAALTGLHAWALADLAAADSGAQDVAEKDHSVQPGWAQLIGPFCRYEINSLDKHTDDPTIGQLAAMLKYLAVEQAGCQPWAVQTATDVLPLIPECYRVYDGLCEFGGVSSSHSATTAPMRLVGKKLYSRLEAMPGLPEEVERIVGDRKPGDGPQNDAFGSRSYDSAGEFKARRQLIDALLRTGELPAAKGPNAAKGPADSHAREPSWAALGIILRELSFMQVYRRARFERYDLDVPVSEWLDAAAPLVERHPCRVLLDTFLPEVEKVNEAQNQLARVDVMGSEYPFALYDACAYRLDNKARQTLANNLFFNRDAVTRDCITYIRHCVRSNADPTTPILDLLMEASPHSPLARAQLVLFHWDEVQEQAVQWDKESAPYPGLSFSLAERYLRLGRLDDAERCAEALVQIVPSDINSYQMLATVYQRQGKTDRWLATLEEYLNQRDFGLGHYSVQSQIAYYYMGIKQWEKALPYAEGAAESYSGWGLLCAAECNEGLQRWSEAEKLQRACSERYQGDSFDWYFFCRRTGKGNLKEARVFARNYVDTLADRAATPNSWDLLLFYLLEEQPEKALAEIEKLVAKKPITDEVLWMALIADQAKDEKKRDETLTQAKRLCSDENDNSQRAH